MTVDQPVRRAHFDRWIVERLPGFVGEIAELVAFDTTSPNEGRAVDWLRDYLTGLDAQVWLEPRHPDLRAHPAANHNAHLHRSNDDRGTLVAHWPGSADRHTLFSAHIDVVPAAPGFVRAFDPHLVDGALVGRGTADTKGNIVMLAAAIRYLAEVGCPRCTVTLDLVVEEEIGGNGALSSVLHGRDVSEVVVLEPTGLEVFHGHRGCLEFTAHITGRASHMGGIGVSAIFGALEFVTLLRELEGRLIDEAQLDPDFAHYDRPVQINVGTIRGGEWHGAIPEHCEVGGAFGFHPKYTVEDVRGLLEQLVQRLTDPWLREHVGLSYDGIHNGAYRGDPDSAVATRLCGAVKLAGRDVDRRRAWCVSCDARLYHDLLAVPVVVFGAGQLESAHSSAERLELDEFTRGVWALAVFLSRSQVPVR